MMRRFFTVVALGMPLLLWHCARHETNPDLEAEKARVQTVSDARGVELEKARKSIARLEAEVQKLKDENAKLGSQVKILKLKDDPSEELRAAQAEAHMYREGLERAVEELNRQARRPRLEAPRQEASPGAESPHRFVFVRRPYVVSDGQGTVYVEGTIHNAADVGLGGYLEINLLVDGAYVETATLTMDLRANTVHDYNHTFRVVVPDGTIQATAAWGSGR